MFFSNQWAPSRSAFQPEFQYNAPTPAAKLRRSPKVVQIPARFLGEQETRSASALTIQKVFRGYLVRKSARNILRIKREVDSIEGRVSKKEVIDLIRQRDGKERLKVNEALMALLFKLDAVSGCGNSEIRLCRKAVIMKTIALQEKVDALANDQILEIEDPHEKFELKSTDPDQTHRESISNSASKDEEEYEFVEQNVAAKGDSCSLMEEDEKEIGVVSEKSVGGGGGDQDLVEQNGKMMKMMVELFEKNAAQAKMLTSLTHRLEQLEKAFVCDKIGRKKKKKKHSP